MKFSKSRDTIGFRKRRSFFCGPIPALALLCIALFITAAFILTDCDQKKCIASGSQVLPEGIVSSTSDLEMRPLWGASVKKKPHTNLLAMAVGMKQKENVDKIVRKFLEESFIVMLFHYDGNVDDWSDLKWSAHALHVAACNQTKWWFAKRFLHPAVVSEYSYIFLWDEDLRVENFNVQRYLSVIKKERLEISQPALDPEKSEVRHQLTARHEETLVHRWVEMMAPVFSRASWRCAWLMIQNDFVDAWGVDFQLGYCVQGNRNKKIGIVDSDYVIHYGFPTLGRAKENKPDIETSSDGAEKGSSKDSPAQEAKSTFNEDDVRNAVRKQSITDLEPFRNIRKKAVDDQYQTDPFQL